MTIDEMLASVNSVFATSAEFSAALAQSNLSSQVAAIDAEIAGLNAKRREALKPFDDAQIELQNKRNELIDQLDKTKA